MQPVDRRVIEKLLIAAAPERWGDLQKLWAVYNPVFVIGEDQRQSTYKTRPNRILFDHKSLTHDWIVGYAGWKAFRAYGPAIVAAWLTGMV